ncbi:MAG: radical SAM family heme chaperone HemW [Candidatus Izemoplasmataceae bacterium]
MLALYIHIPFCQAICTYCDFVKEVANDDKKSAYIKALQKEIISYQLASKNINTIYIGGGTPSYLPLDDLESLLKTLHMEINFKDVLEFTVECNPNDVTIDLATLLKKYGVNRISLGVQTFNEKQLKFLNRKHDNQDVLNAMKRFNEVGITNISIDLIFSLINQTLDDVKKDLEFALSLNIKHISYYSLILEEKTRLHHLVSKGKVSMNDSDLEAMMYEYIIDRMQHTPFHHYEISNFAMKGYESKHNLVYWQNDDYIGVGTGAHGKIHDVRYVNISHVKAYLNAIENHKSVVLETYPYEGLRDALLMGLRVLKGVDVASLNKTFNVDLFQVYPKLNTFIHEGFLAYEEGYLKFTRKGIMLGNYIFEIF